MGKIHGSDGRSADGQSHNNEKTHISFGHSLEGQITVIMSKVFVGHSVRCAKPITDNGCEEQWLVADAFHWYVRACVRVCVCACVCERERD